MQSMKNDFSSSQRGPKKAAGRSRKKGSPVTEERAKAQRAKLDAQAEARSEQEEQETSESRIDSSPRGDTPSFSPDSALF